ncbi:MAG TPA: hypothetical protein VHZ29_14735 [Rhizomicrobium sp.]|jgi:hypothetical protein|nr:hypothetical protein [Rhizomicrobium sp.]
MDGVYSVIRIILTIMGVLMFLAGVLWALQGAGLVMWPANSFMLKDPKWVFNGILMANFGLLQLYVARSR